MGGLGTTRADVVAKTPVAGWFAFDRFGRYDNRAAGGRQWTPRAYSTRPALGRLLIKRLAGDAALLFGSISGADATWRVRFREHWGM